MNLKKLFLDRNCLKIILRENVKEVHYLSQHISGLKLIDYRTHIQVLIRKWIKWTRWIWIKWFM